MADTTLAASCGFFDSVNDDRLYSADDMNKPYYRLFGNGVFSSENGVPSNGLAVFTQVPNTLFFTIKKGGGIFSGKWFEFPSDQGLSAALNPDSNPRIDSVIVQIDNRVSGRLGQIVYRKGTPSETPQPPSINDTIGVDEYRVANITVTGSKISNIEDLRGTDSCPYISTFDSYETAWYVIQLSHGTAASVLPAYKRVGKTVFIHGSITDAPALDTTIGVLRDGYRPLWNHYFTAVATNNGAITATLVIRVATNGVVSIVAGSGYSLSDEIHLDTSFTVV